MVFLLCLYVFSFVGLVTAVIAAAAAAVVATHRPIIKHLLLLLLQIVPFVISRRLFFLEDHDEPR